MTVKSEFFATKFVSTTEIFIEVSMKRKGEISVTANRIYQGRPTAWRYWREWQPEGQKTSVSKQKLNCENSVIMYVTGEKGESITPNFISLFYAGQIGRKHAETLTVPFRVSVCIKGRKTQIRVPIGRSIALCSQQVSVRDSNIFQP